MHGRGKTADVVVGLYGLAGTAERDALDDVRVERALQEPFDRACLLGTFRCSRDGGSCFLEHVDEVLADDLALLFGVCDALKGCEEPLAGVDDGEVDA